jgi:hypothetical protein
MTASPLIRRRSLLSQDWCAVLGVGLVAIVARLAVLPIATTDGGDAPLRVWKAWAWMADPQ